MEQITAPSQVAAISADTAGATTTNGLQPGHDIFCTPENKAFYESDTYTDLDPTTNEVRLVRLLPDTGNGNGQIHCELLHPIQLEEIKGAYSAPSYCAGSAEATTPILLNGMVFNVFSNLGHALFEIRKFWRSRHYGKECLLWIDQISINQNNIKERSHQVRFMREIYANAQQVLVCLSTKKTSSRGPRWALSVMDEVPLDYNLEYLEDVSADFHRRLEKHISTQLRDDKFIRSWISFYEMVESRWFTRAWVFQEFIVAPDVLFIYAGWATHVNQARCVWSSICSWRCNDIMNVIHTTMEREKFDGHSEDYPKSLNRLMKWVENDPRETIASRMMSMFDARFSWWNGNEQANKFLDLKKTLTHSRYCNATDPRDKVYAFLGLTNPRYNILPDYERSVEEVLIEATSRIIQSEGNLDVLYYATVSQLRQHYVLPSWVVDWTCREIPAYRGASSSTIRDICTYTGLSQIETAPLVVRIEISKHPRVALAVRGVLLERLESPSLATHYSLESRPNFRQVRSNKGFTLVCPARVDRDDELWIIEGSGTPLILRPCDEYELIAVAQFQRYGRRVHEDERRKHWKILLDDAKREQGGWRQIYIL